jgi:hypothetical protein
MIDTRDTLTKPEIFNIGSFNATIGDAGITVAEKTKSTVNTMTTSTDTGFTMNCAGFIGLDIHSLAQRT